MRCEVADDGLAVTDAAWDSYQDVEQISMRRPGGTEEFGFELVGDFPIIKRFPVTPRSTGRS